MLVKRVSELSSFYFCAIEGKKNKKNAIYFGSVKKKIAW